jgi:hypothetical protein
MLTKTIVFISAIITLSYGNSNSVDLDKLCINNDAKACFDLGEKYAYGDNKNIKLAIKYFTKACDLNHTESCFSLATIYHKGRKHKKESVKYYTIACNNDNGKACNNLGNMYRDGIGVEKNITKALELFQIACDSEDGVEKGCTNKTNLEELLSRTQVQK